MYCTPCKTKGLARGLKNIFCTTCNKFKLVNVGSKIIMCGECATSQGICEICGSNMSKEMVRKSCDNCKYGLKTLCQKPQYNESCENYSHWKPKEETNMIAEAWCECGFTKIGRAHV